MCRPWSSQLAADLARERARLQIAFIELRSLLVRSDSSAFAGGAVERTRMLAETEHDYASLASAGAEAVRLEARLEFADREATQREVDAASIILEQLSELVSGVNRRLPDNDE